MSFKYPIRAGGYRPEGGRRLVTRPKEFAYFSYNDNHEYRQDDSSLRWYYHSPLDIGADLSSGFERFDKLDNSAPDHIDSLLRTIIDYEQREGKRIDAEIVTWRGMMTKILTSPFENRDGFEMNATLFQGCLFIEENHAYKQGLMKQQNENRQRRGRFTPEQMTFWGYKFETLTTLPRPWSEMSRTDIEERCNEVVSNKAQYCSVVSTNMGPTKLCLGGEVDALWGSKPKDPDVPTDWVELKTSQELQSDRDAQFFHAKLLKFWAQSYLLGVPRVIVGFRSREGRLLRVQEFRTAEMPGVRPRDWDADVCVDFSIEFLGWLRKTISEEGGVWRIKRAPGTPLIEVFKVAEQGYGEVLTDEFVAWRTSDALQGAEAMS